MSKRTMMVDVEVDIWDVIDALSEEDIVELLANLDPKRFDEVLRRRARVPAYDPSISAVDDAIELLRAGRSEEALLLLERSAHPKWSSLADCERDCRAVGATT